MKRFSERIGVTAVPTFIQVDEISIGLRNTIWNFFFSLFNPDEKWWSASRAFAQWHYKEPVDELPDYNIPCRDWIKAKFNESKWYEVYDLVEFVCENMQQIEKYSSWDKQKLYSVFNKIFETELSGYRFIAGSLVPISNHEEANALEAALEVTSRYGLAGAHTHIATAIRLIAKRPDPDYRNSIKESISAVESLAIQISEVESQGLSGALNRLSQKAPIHDLIRNLPQPRPTGHTSARISGPTRQISEKSHG